MQLRTCILSAFTLSTALFFGLAAMAGELPKEGTYKGTYAGVGTFKINRIGKGSLVFFDETGLATTDGLFDHTTSRCWGTGDWMEHVGIDQGYCMATDLAGDKIFQKFLTEKHTPDQKHWSVSVTCIGGTGKYTGISCDETDITYMNEFPAAPEGTYVDYGTIQGSYKLP
jgi:hypothetical protein